MRRLALKTGENRDDAPSLWDGVNWRKPAAWRAPGLAQRSGLERKRKDRMNSGEQLPTYATEAPAQPTNIV